MGVDANIKNSEELRVMNDERTTFGGLGLIFIKLKNGKVAI